MSSPSRPWNLEQIDPPAGVALLDHVVSLLPADGRGPLPGGGDPLPDEAESAPHQLRFAPGVEDAILPSGGAGEQSAAAAAAVLMLLSGEPSQRAVDAAVARLADLSGPQEMDGLLPAVYDGQPPAQRLATFARWLCRHGTHRAVVKAGLALLGISGGEDDVELIVTLGLAEELTLYAVVAVENLLARPERAIFDLARQVQGWGRIQAIRRLRETTDPEIARWLVYGGYANSVMVEETAFVAAVAGGLRRLLEQEPDDDDELLDHAGALLAGLAGGGPAEDLGDYPDAAPALAAYLRRLERAAPSLSRLRDLVVVDGYLRAGVTDNPYLDPAAAGQLQGQAERLLARPGWSPLVQDALAAGDKRELARAVALAQRLGIDPRPVLWEWLEREPLDEFLWYQLCSGAGRDDVHRLAQAADSLLPLRELAGGPASDLGLGPDYAADGCLGFLLHALAEFPGEGWPVIAAGLRNRVVRNRSLALQALGHWPRDAWPADAEPALQEVFWKEPVQEVRARIRALIDEGRGSR